MVIPEGDADRYSSFLTTFFGLAMTVLRTLHVDKDTVPALFVFDEAGNIPIHGLKEMLGVGRGRKVAVVLAYQNLGQVYAHYGQAADAVLGSINTMIFLPCLDQRTTEFGSKRVGRTTVLQHTTVDAVGDQNDAERLAESKRDLMDPAELRPLVRHKQAVAIIDTAAPIKLSYAIAFLPDDQCSHPEHTGNTTHPIVPTGRGLKRANHQRRDALGPKLALMQACPRTSLKEKIRPRHLGSTLNQ